MTSVIGHLTGLDFDQQYRKWNSCPPGQLFEAPVINQVAQVEKFPNALGTLLILCKDKTAIAQNITNQARYAKALFIWTDCDREGEYIGAEVRQAAFKGNARLEIKRAQFSNTERA